MIDITTENPITLDQARHKLPPSRKGKAVTISCILRWILDGVRTADGQIVRLEAIRMGGRWLTSEAALQRFGEAQTPNLNGQNVTVRPPSSRRKAAERAGKELERIGI